MVGIVILNWNGLDDTLRCLKSLQEAKSPNIPTEVIVVDNGSKIDPGDQIKRDFPDVDYVRLNTNAGYAAGCNLGADRALAHGAELVLFLNNDTEVESDFLVELVAAVQDNPRIGLACSLIKTMDGEIEFAGAKINFATGSFKSLHRLERGLSPFQTAYATGCSLLVPARTLQAIGTFDEKLFSYFEDTDLSLRARRAGFETVLVPKSVVRHKGAASTRRGLTEGTTSPFKHYLVARNRLLLVRRYASIWAKPCFLLIVQPLIIICYLAGFAVRRRRDKAREFLRGLYDGLFKEDPGLDIPN